MKIRPLWSTLLLVFALASVSPASADWIQTAGPAPGPVTVLSLDAANGDLFAIASQSPYRSQDGGATWQPLWNGLPGDLIAGAIAADGPNVFLGGTTSGTVVYRSTDGGITWTKATATGLPGVSTIWAFWIEGGKVLAALESNGVYASTDGGDTWTDSNSGVPPNTGIPPSTGISRFAKSGSDLFAGTSIASPIKGIYRSTDGGASWSPTSIPFLAGFTSLFGLAGNANGAYAATSTNGAWRTVDHGATWQKINPDASTNFLGGIYADAGNVWVATNRLYRADANGDNWTQTSTGLPPTNPGLAIPAISSSGSNVVAGVGKQGVYRTTDAGANWSASNSGLRAARTGGMLAYGSYVFANADGAGFFRSANHGNTWTEIDNGIPPYTGWYHFARTGTTLLGGNGAGSLFRSDNDGDLWTPSNTGLGLTGTFCFAVDETTPSTVFAAGYFGVSKSVDSGMNWTPLTTGFTNTQTVLDLLKDGPYLVAGANAGIKRSTDGGDTWTAPITGQPTFGSFGAFAISGGAYFMATSAAGVYQSVDHGETWSIRNTGVGGTPSALLAVGTDLFAGTSAGVFQTSDGGANWIPIDQGLPDKLPVLELTADDTYLYAGTLRNGVWRRPLSEVVPVLASFVSADAVDDLVRVSWWFDSELEVTVERRGPATDWTRIGTRTADAFGYVTIADSDVAAGGRYAYRLRWNAADGAVTAGEVWVDVPARTRLALLGTRPNPSGAVPAVSLTLPRAGRVTLDLFDLQGRRAGEPFEADLAAGAHVLPVAAWSGRNAGVYVVRLGFGGEVRTARIVRTK